MTVDPSKIVLKVEIFCTKCKHNIMKTISKLHGIDKIEIDAAKGTVTVIGDVDPVQVKKQLDKIKRPSQILTVGPAKEEEKKDGKKDEPCNLPPLPPCCRECEVITVTSQDYGGCSIM